MASTLAGKPLTVHEATFGGFFDTSRADWGEIDVNERFWGINIYASYDDFEHEGTTYSQWVRFYYDGFLFPNSPCGWEDLTGQILDWDSSSEFEPDGPWPSFYLWSHQDVEHGRIQFVERDGRNFRVVWEGATETHGDFFIDTWVKFEGRSFNPDMRPY